MKRLLTESKEYMSCIFGEAKEKLTNKVDFIGYKYRSNAAELAVHFYGLSKEERKQRIKEVERKNIECGKILKNCDKKYGRVKAASIIGRIVTAPTTAVAATLAVTTLPITYSGLTAGIAYNNFLEDQSFGIGENIFALTGGFIGTATLVPASLAIGGIASVFALPAYGAAKITKELTKNLVKDSERAFTDIGKMIGKETFKEIVFLGSEQTKEPVVENL